LQISDTRVSANEDILVARGPIIAGDAERLQTALSGLPPALRLLGLVLDSQGGSVAEAKQLGGIIRARRLAVIIPHAGRCASACFMLLAASPRRLAANDALIGVHSAAEDGAETDTSLAVTTLMARDAAELGVPPAIIGKMVETAPGQIAQLDSRDLALMNVTVFSGDPAAAVRQAEGSAAQRAGTLMPTATLAPGPQGFTAGRDDRRLWDAWVMFLHGAYREGALFALDRMNQPAPVSCNAADNVSRGDFTAGCDAARQRLAPIAARLRADTDYAAGWAAVGPPGGAPGAVPGGPLGGAPGGSRAWSVPVIAGEQVEQEYQGVYFCTGSVVHLTLKLYPPAAAARRRALLLFGPNASSPNVPHGAFLVEGAIGSADGEITLVPVKWISQPPGYPWLGLSGRSADGGRTYRGRVTDNNACTQFTLARISGTAAARQ
jgi:hypothetical protein